MREDIHLSKQDWEKAVNHWADKDMEEYETEQDWQYIGKDAEYLIGSECINGVPHPYDLKSTEK